MPTRTRARRRPLARIASRAEARSELVALRDNLAAIDAHVAAIQRPVHAVRSLIEQVKAPLAFPARLHQDLTDLHQLLASLRTTVTPLSLLPGPIGPASRALKQALEVLAGPPRTGSIGRTRDLVGEIDRRLEPLRKLVQKIETPVAETAKAVDAMAASVAYLRAMVASVIARYGENPPEDVEACAAKLNEPIASLRAALDEVAARTAALFAAIEAALRSALAVLKPLGDALRTIQQVLGVFRGKAMRAIRSAIERFANGIRPWVNKAEFIVKTAINRILKKLGVSVGSFAGYLRKVIGALDPMKPIERAVSAALGAVKRFIAALVDASGIAELLATLAELKDRLARAVEGFLRSQCKAVLDPEPAGFAARRRR
jgi:hypothetical protein